MRTKKRLPPIFPFQSLLLLLIMKMIRMPAALENWNANLFLFFPYQFFNITSVTKTALYTNCRANHSPIIITILAGHIAATGTAIFIC